MTSVEWGPLLVCGAVVYVGLCKVVYNGLLATEEEQFSDLMISKTLLLALVASFLSFYVFKYYKRIKIPGQGAPTLQTPTHARTDAPLLSTSSRRISSLVPAQDSAFTSLH